MGAPAAAMNALPASLQARPDVLQQPPLSPFSPSPPQPPVLPLFRGP